MTVVLVVDFKQNFQPVFYINSTNICNVELRPGGRNQLNQASPFNKGTQYWRQTKEVLYRKALQGMPKREEGCQKEEQNPGTNRNEFL